MISVQGASGYRGDDEKDDDDDDEVGEGDEVGDRLWPYDRPISGALRQENIEVRKRLQGCCMA